MQWPVNEGHLTNSDELKTAFLSGDPDPTHRGNDAASVDPLADLKFWLHPASSDILRLRAAVHGMMSAPLRWHQRLSRALHHAGFCCAAGGSMHLDFALFSTCVT